MNTASPLNQVATCANQIHFALVAAHGEAVRVQSPWDAALALVM